MSLDEDSDLPLNIQIITATSLLNTMYVIPELLNQYYTQFAANTK